MSATPFRHVGTTNPGGRGRPRLHNEANPADIGDKYDPNAFYTRASDTHGHSVQVRTNIPKDWAAMVGHLVERYPAYLSMADLARDGVFHRIKFLIDHEGDPELQRSFAEAEALTRIEASREQDRHRAQALDAIKYDLDELKHKRNWTVLAQRLAELEALAVALPSPYREQAERLADEYR